MKYIGEEYWMPFAHMHYMKHRHKWIQEMSPGEWIHIVSEFEREHWKLKPDTYVVGIAIGGDNNIIARQLTKEQYTQALLAWTSVLKDKNKIH